MRISYKLIPNFNNKIKNYKKILIKLISNMKYKRMFLQKYNKVRFYPNREKTLKNIFNIYMMKLIFMNKKFRY